MYTYICKYVYMYIYKYIYIYIYIYMYLFIYILIYIHIFICHAGANQHLLLRERPPLQLAPVLGQSQGRLAHPLRRLFGRGRLQEVCGRQRRVSLLWRGQVHGRVVVDWLRAVVAHGEVALQLEVPPTMSKIIERYNLKFQHFTSQGGAC